MTQKEISEIRRRFRADKTNIGKIRGCYVNEKNEIVTEFSQPIVSMLEDEAEEILSVFKKSLSGSIGKNLIDIEFSNSQVLDSEEHRLLMAVKNSSLDADNAVNELYNRIINSVSVQGNYLILLANDKYDVFTYSEVGKKSEDSSEMFSYIVCCVCPIKLTKPALSFFAFENAFHNIAANSIVASPEIGFMFPAFDDRAGNIYSALFYTHSTSASNHEFVESIFNCTVPMPASIQKEAFSELIAETIPDEQKFDVLKALQDEVCEIIEEHKANNETQPLKMSKNSIKKVLEECSVEEDSIKSFEQKYDEDFGEDTKLCPMNIVDPKKFELNTADVSIKVNPECSYLVKTQIIDGLKYIMIRADENVEVNGVNISIL